MGLNFRPPMYVVAAALLGLIATLATLQYRWLGQVSAAERERMQANLAARSTAFAQDFDREVTRAYLTFQVDSLHNGANLASQMAERYDSWQGTSRYPKLVKDIYIVPRDPGDPAGVRRFNTTTRFVEPSSWPEELLPLRERFAEPEPPAQPGTFVIRSMPQTVWAAIPALVVPMPVLMVNSVSISNGIPQMSDVIRRSSLSYTVLLLDHAYMTGEVLPALARQHFRGASEGIDYHVAVVSSGTRSAVYSTDTGFTPAPDAQADAAADLFQIRAQEFSAMANEVRRFTSLISRVREGDGVARSAEQKRGAEIREMLMARGGSTSFTLRETPPVTVMLQHGAPGGERRVLESGIATAQPSRAAAVTAPWRLVVKHPAGSLETAVTSVRRRNLLVSSGILAILGASVAFLVVSTRRAQDLARQQMEFVAAVSHELRTPLAVIRSAADNLAEGVVTGDGPVRKYGDLMRGEGRRLSEMVEQILELAGIQSGQRGFALRPVPVLPLVHEVVRASEPLLQGAALDVELDLPEDLPPVLGDEQALRRVVQNLVGNAIKYGASGRWIGVKARAAGREVQVAVTDRGLGIAPAEQENIFKPFYRTPDVIAAQIQGAGLGLSLVQRIVEAHGGRITVKSTPGEGSAFTIHLPAATEEPATRTATTSSPASART
jgi:two-component system, OmpR family, sensor histidine kinase SenX3